MTEPSLPGESPDDGPAVVRARGLKVSRGRNPVVRGVDLTVRPGETVAVLGPNGAGKSTLLEAIGGLLPAGGGKIDRTGRVATVLQTPGLARRSVRANVELALAWWGVPRRERRPRAVEALTRMGAEHLARRPAVALSGGERRRVHVARGLALRPDLLLLDEPFAGLDPQTRAKLSDDTGLALRATADAGGAVVVVLHERAEAWALADRIVVMLDGRIAADGEPRTLLDRPPSAAVARFLGYDGELRARDHVLLTRSAHVRLDVHGEHEGVVRHIVRREDDLRLTVDTEAGWVVVTRPWGDVVVGDDVRFRLEGGARFPLEEKSAAT